MVDRMFCRSLSCIRGVAADCAVGVGVVADVVTAVAVVLLGWEGRAAAVTGLGWVGVTSPELVVRVPVVV